MKFRTLNVEIQNTLGKLERRFAAKVRRARATAFKLHGHGTTAHEDALRHATLAALMHRPLVEAADIFDVMAMPM